MTTKEKYHGAWGRWGGYEFVEQLGYLLRLSNKRVQYLRDFIDRDGKKIREFYEAHTDEPYYIDEFGGLVLSIGYVTQKITRIHLAKFLREQRKLQNIFVDK